MLSLSHVIVILLFCILIFGSGRVVKLMSDLAKGIKVFKKELNEESSDLKIDDR